MKNLMILIRRSIYIGAGLFDKLIGRRNNLFVLCYHSINNDGWRYGISVSEFRKQMTFISQNYDVISSEDLGKYLIGKKSLKKPTVVITFDDGYADILSAQKVVRDLNIKPTAFVIADNKNADKRQLQTSRRLLTNKEIISLKNDGWIIGSHSMTHADFDALSEQQVKIEVVESKQKLEKDLKINIDSIAYPKGKYDDRIIDQSKCYGFGFSMDDGLIDRNVNKLAIPRVGIDRSHSFEEFKYLASPSVLVIRGLLKNFLGGMI